MLLLHLCESRVLEYLLSVTDHSYIEQSSFAEGHHHSSLVGAGRFHDADSEATNIFMLAITDERSMLCGICCLDSLTEFCVRCRFDLVRVLVSGGLDPDRFPTQWSFEEDLPRNHLGAKYKWATPLSVLVSRSWFLDETLSNLRFLVESGIKFPLSRTY